MQQRNERLAIIQMGRIGHHRLDRCVVREHFVVRVQNRATLGVDRLFVDVFFRGESGVLLVFDHLQINKPKRKYAEQHREPEADQRATNPAVPLHLPARLFATGWTASSPSGRAGAPNRTMLRSEIGIILRYPSLSRRCIAEREVRAAICTLATSFCARKLVSSFSSAFLRSPK